MVRLIINVSLVLFLKIQGTKFTKENVYSFYNFCLCWYNRDKAYLEGRAMSYFIGASCW